jgi:hypothetical protein
MAEKIRIKGHEKFALREGWLTKGLYAANDNPKIFNDESAPDVLGVGTNMVKSIRYWMQAFGLLERKGNVEDVSELGRILMEKDPYFEDYFSLWILHSNIAKNVSVATTWYMFFNDFQIEEFEKEELIKHLMIEIQAKFGQKVLESSLKDDVDVLLNTYSKFNELNDDPEDKNQNPLSTLGLVKKSENVYIKVQPDLRKINNDVILYELANLLNEKKSMSIDDVVMGNNGIGNIYNLSKVAATGYLEKLSDKGFIQLERTAGIDMVYKLNMPSPNEIVREYYK